MDITVKLFTYLNLSLAVQQDLCGRMSNSIKFSPEIYFQKPLKCNIESQLCSHVSFRKCW